MKLSGIVLSLMFAAATPVLAAECSESTLEIRGSGVQAQFEVEIARTAAEQAQGLMFRESMPQFSGMLFVYERPHSVSFWMKNTLIPLDMFFIDPAGIVQRIKHSATPLDTTPVPGGLNIQYVLELNGGMANMLGLSEGAEIRYQGILAENAIWPCE